MDEVEIVSRDEEAYEVVPITPLRRLEERIKKIEMSTVVPQIQSLITQIIELIKTNQRLVDDIMRANNSLREELSRTVDKINKLTKSMEELIEMIKSASEEELSSLLTRVEIPEIKELVKMQKDLLDTNQRILEGIEQLNRKIRAGTPVSHILAQYPNIKLKSVR